MRKFLVCFAAMALVATLNTTVRAQCGTLFGECLINGNLDAGTAGNGSMTGTNPPWTVTSSVVDAAIFQPGFADNTLAGNGPDEGLGIWYRSFRGGGTSGNPPVDADLAQTIDPVPTAGLYKLTFDYLVETNFTAASMTATLSSSGGDIDTLDLLTSPRTSVGGGFNGVGNIPQVGTLLVNADVGDTLTVSLAMVDGVAGSGNPQSFVADRFSLTRVPEPASATLGLLALLGIAGFARRR